MISWHMMLHWFSDFCILLACVGCAYLLTAAVSTLMYVRGRAPRCERPLPVTVFKPLHREDSRIFPCLASFCAQRYDAPVQIVFGVSDRSDPAVATVKQLQAAFPGQSIELQIDARAHGTNGKVSNLINMMRLARHPVLVLADSDILVGPDHLERLVGALQEPGVGAVTCLYHGIGVSGVWSTLSALGINAHFLPNAIFGVSSGLALPCFGSTIALNRETLGAIGGLETVADSIADDYSLGEAVRSLGYKVEIPEFSVGHACKETSMRNLLDHELRWARTVRTLDPVGYCGTALTHPLAFALLAAAAGSAAGLGVAGLAVLCRWTVCACAEWRFGLQRQPYWMLPIRDLLSFAVFVSSLFGRTVMWKGRTHRAANGTLLPNRRTSP